MDGNMRLCYWATFFVLAIGVIFPSYAHEVMVAVSSSIQAPMSAVCNRFAQATKHRCKIINAPTGHLYAHIMHGTSYDVLISSDEIYTQGLINAEKADPEGRFVLATGSVILYSQANNVSQEQLKSVLLEHENTNIVIPNPGRTAYGVAAREVLLSYKLWHSSQGRIIYAKSLQHAYELLQENDSYVGFISPAQLTPLVRAKRQYHEPDKNIYKPVLHEVVLLKNSSDQQVANMLLNFLKTHETCQILQEAGFNCFATETNL